MTAVLIIASSGAVAQASITNVAGGRPPPGTGVSNRPIPGTPHFSVAKGTPVEEVRQLVRCGGTMYAVGTFSQILQGSSVFRRHNVFSFSAKPPFTMTSWAPKVNGEVDSITFRSGKCSRAYIGGTFSSVNGTAVKNLAEITTHRGAVVTRFRHHAVGRVNTLLAVGGRILVGGLYKTINRSSADPFMTALNAKTGRDDGFLHLRIRGRIHPGNGVTEVFNQALSHNRRFDLVIGDFTSVGGKRRRQIFMLNVAGSKAKVTGWTSPAFAGHCIYQEPAYIRAASWSPDDSRIYIATTGRHPRGWRKGDFPLTGLCDAAAAFPVTRTSVKPSWINYTGCNSLYSTAADAGTVYFGGHESWASNPDGCKFKGRGAITSDGMQGLSPRTGALYVKSRHKAGYYERSRGYGADDMLLTKAGLWIASDNFEDSQTCGSVSGLAGICFLPYR